MFLALPLYYMCHVCSCTSNIQRGLMAVARVCNIGGNTAEHPTIHLLHTSHLENALGQKSVSANRGEGKYSTCIICIIYIDSKVMCQTCCLWCWEVFGFSPRWCSPQVLRWSHTESGRPLPAPQTWTLGGCETWAELWKKSYTFSLDG